MMEAVVSPLQEKMDDWRKIATALDKDHAKGDFDYFCHENGNKLYENVLEIAEVTLKIHNYFTLLKTD